ncbi:unnamed protein product [Sordaria macrospora k-hell]|uniref:UBX domain-containing protein 2 n=1 Tax=Sordaria macrospora (strain ATCC MYA-333 / DSM 997 / K(L3346) / K-hell) TaxID=771870 RepID=F7VUU4_SORMK|nr:uncharacterized protein SMAC_09062 [Sordaria macrospora k-hell]CCC09290.1 unnamed protein product [Sordaria macrospora k-hell]
MFFTGTLQEGIAAAIQQTKSVVCFVTDDNTESQQWETDFFTDQAISPLIESSAVVLKLIAGSTEEGYLAQLFPVPNKPTVVVLRGGQLKEYIAAGVTKEDFLRRLGAALSEQQAVSTGSGTTSGSPSVMQDQDQGQKQGQEQTSSESTTAQPPTAEQSTAPAAATSTEATTTTTSQQPPISATTNTGPTTASSASPPATATTTTTPNTTTQQAQIQAILAERAVRLAAQKKQQEEATRAAARARAAAEDPNSPARQAADALRKKQQEAREERQRILKTIEDDKAARKARQLEKQREKETLLSKESGEAAEDKKGKGKGKAKEESLPFAPASPMLPRGNQPVKSIGHCALQVRLTDGSTIRSRFSAEKDTVREVREWVEATAPNAKKGKYSFKVLLTPQPSRRIEQEDEEMTLGELGLAPSSTLILVPTTGSSGSRRSRVHFAGGVAATEGGGNIFQRLIGFVLAFFNTVVTFFSTLFSVSGPLNASASPEQVAAEVRGAQQAETASSSGRSLGGGGSAGAVVNRGTTTTGGSRIKGFGDDERRRDEERKRNNDQQQQFYNGNSVSNT